MNRGVMWLLILIMLATVSCAVMLAGGVQIPLFPTSDYEIGLPNGYRLDRTASKTVGICSGNDEVIVEPHIDKYHAYPDVVVGHVVKHRASFFHSIPGYFILDTRSGHLKQGLSMKAWLSELRRVGISAAPKMQAVRE